MTEERNIKSARTPRRANTTRRTAPTIPADEARFETKSEGKPNLDDEVDRMFTSYRTQGRPLVSIRYESPSFGPPGKLHSTMERVHSSEQKLGELTRSHEQVERQMLRQFGYEDVPVLMRPIEAVRRFFAVTEGTTLEALTRIGNHYVDRMHTMNGELVDLLKTYGAASSHVEAHLASLEDQMIDLSERKQETEARLKAIGEVKQRYEADAPHNGSYADKVMWKRGLRVLEKDDRALRSLNLRVTQDLNQTIELHRVTEQVGEMLEISETMNSMAASSSARLAEQLALNINLYTTSSRSSDVALRIKGYLEKSAAFSDMMSDATYGRMNAVGAMLNEFAAPGGRGANAISGGGLLNGLRGYLMDMQKMHDEVVKQRTDDMLI